MPKNKKNNNKAADYEYLGTPRNMGQNQNRNANNEYAQDMSPESKVTKAKPKGGC